MSELIDFFVIICPNQDGIVKRFNGKKCYIPKGIIKNYNVNITEKKKYSGPIDSDTKRYKGLRKVNNRTRLRLCKSMFIRL